MLRIEFHDAIKFLVKNNIMFANPIKKILKPQSKLDLLAVKEILSQNY